MTKSIVDSFERGERIRTLRIEKKMTVQEVADFLGLDKSTLSRYESGKTGKINQSTIEKLALILGTTFEYIQYGLDKRPESKVSFPQETAAHSDKASVAAPRFSYSSGSNTKGISQSVVYTVKELSSAVLSGNAPQIMFTLRAEDGSMLPRINPGDLLLIQPSSKLMADKVNILLSHSGEILIRDVEKNDDRFVVKKRNGEDIKLIEPANYSKYIKQVIGFCICLQTSEI